MSKDRLTLLMKNAGHTTITLADKLGVSDRQVRRWVKGESQPNSKQIRELAIELHSTSDFLLELSDEPTSFTNPAADLNRHEWNIVAALRRGDEKSAMRLIVNG